MAMVEDVDGQWLFEPSHFLHTPSRTVDDMPPPHELKLRNEGIHFLLRSGNSLKLKSNVLSSAATYFHRFYMRFSIGPSGYDRIQIATAALFLASKVEESTRKLKDVASICYVKYTGDQSFKGADKWADRILINEAILLDALCFDLIITHPHEYLSEAFSGGVRDSLGWLWQGALAKASVIPKGLYQLAWSIANDSLRTPVCLFFQPRLIACACYLIAYVVTANPTPDAPSERPSPLGSPNPNMSQALEPVEQPAVDELDALQAGETSLNDGPDPVEPDDLGAGINATPSPKSRAPSELPALSIDDLLSGSSGAGPWRRAFGVTDSDLKPLADIVGNILELYNVADQPALIDMQRVVPPRGYDSFTGFSPANVPAQSVTTSNSSPALTLASNATPMHRQGEDGSQEFIEAMADNGEEDLGASSMDDREAAAPPLVSSNHDAPGQEMELES